MRFITMMGLLLGLVLSGQAIASQAENKPEKTDITLSVGGASLFYYLPLAIAEQKGFFKEQGLDVKVIDFKGGSQSLQAMIGGSADVTTGAYEQVIRMQTKGQDVRAVIELDKSPAVVLAIRKDLVGKVKTPADLKGMKIGVTAPGSSTNNFANYVLGQHGVKPDEVSFIAVGTGSTAIAAMKRGEIDAIANFDPVIANLEHDGDIAILVDTRTAEGLKDVLGADTMTAAVLFAKKRFIDDNPNTVQALTNALHKALLWLQTATPDEVADTVPPAFVGNNRDVYIQAVKNSLPTYSTDGLMSRAGMETALKLLSVDPAIAATEIDLDKTVDDRFIRLANETNK